MACTDRSKMARQNNKENKDIQQDAELFLSEVTQDEGYADLVTKTEGSAVNRLSLLVKGVHCAGCIQKIESTLYAEDAVSLARLNFSTGRLYIEWTGDELLANQMVQRIESLGYSVFPYEDNKVSEESAKEERFLLMCMGVAGFAMGNIMLLSVGVWTSTTESMGMNTRELLHWISASIALPTLLFSARPFFRSAYQVLKNGHTNMDVPISLALILASMMSVYETITHGEYVYFDSAVMLTFFLLIGRYLDFKARRKARGAAADLMQTFKGFAVVVEGNKQRRIPIRDVKQGMHIAVAMGEKVPVDGKIIKGQSAIDTSIVTGETLPRPAGIGDEVYAGTMNLDKPLVVEVTKAAEDSLFADVIRLMEKAEQGQAAYVRLADRAARLYTPVVHVLALAAFLLWWGVLGVTWQQALLIAVTVLIITCPCALGLAVPVVQVLATGRLMKNGILVKAGDAFERLAKIDKVVFDKTGTLTCGTPELVGVYDEAVLSIAASLASHSRHPLSQALCRGYKGSVLELQKVEEHAGQGLEALYQGKPIRLGNAVWCGAVQNTGDSPHIEIWISREGEAPVVFSFSDQLREDTKDIVQYFAHSNMKPLLLSGDREEVVQDVATKTGIEFYKYEQKPTNKYDVVERLKKDHNVLMVGDGLNDAPVLAAANISMAPGSAIDVAQNAADIVFMGDQLTPVWEAYKVARTTQKLVKQNFVLAVIYNIIAVPIAFMGLVTPMIAAIAMSGSSLLVILNSFRLRWQK